MLSPSVQKINRRTKVESHGTMKTNKFYLSSSNTLEKEDNSSYVYRLRMNSIFAYNIMEMFKQGSPFSYGEIVKQICR